MNSADLMRKAFFVCFCTTAGIKCEDIVKKQKQCLLSYVSFPSVLWLSSPQWNCHLDVCVVWQSWVSKMLWSCQLSHFSLIFELLLFSSVLPSEPKRALYYQCWGVKWMMNCYVGQQYSVFSVKTMTFLSLVGLLECIVFCCCLHPPYFLIFFNTILRLLVPLLDGFRFLSVWNVCTCVCMNTENTFKHILSVEVFCTHCIE